MTDTPGKRLSRREFTRGLAAFTLGAPFASAVAGDNASQPLDAPLIDDPAFHRGFDIIERTAGSHKVEGRLAPDFETGASLWTLAQWYSRFDLANAPREVLPDGGVRFFDGAKAVTFGAPGTSEADLTLELNGRAEYNDAPPAPGGSWPHLLAGQHPRPKAPISKLSAVRIGVSYRLLRADAYRGEGWSDRRHTAQFTLYFTIQNLSHASPGYGDYLWFGVPFYDARYPMPNPTHMQDRGNAHKSGTDKFIYTPGGAVFTDKKAIDGGWISIDHDLLPHMRDALNAAWSAGFLQGSSNLDDYRIGGLNVGWEVTGTWDVSMRVRGLSLVESMLA